MMRSTLLAALVSAALPTMALAQTADELKNDDKTPGDVLIYGMGYCRQRFSPLTQINHTDRQAAGPGVVATASPTIAGSSGQRRWSRTGSSTSRPR